MPFGRNTWYLSEKRAAVWSRFTVVSRGSKRERPLWSERNLFTTMLAVRMFPGLRLTWALARLLIRQALDWSAFRGSSFTMSTLYSPSGARRNQAFPLRRGPENVPRGVQEFQCKPPLRV